METFTETLKEEIRIRKNQLSSDLDFLEASAERSDIHGSIFVVGSLVVSSLDGAFHIQAILLVLGLMYWGSSFYVKRKVKKARKEIR